MKRLTFTLFLVFIIWIRSNAFSSQEGTIKEQLSDGFNSEIDTQIFIDDQFQVSFSAKDGLLSTSTNAIAQAKDGFIWIGGYGGLVRYDGTGFMPFGQGKLSNITDLATASDGTLWISSADCGLVRYKDGVLDYYSERTNALNEGVESLALCSDKTLYFGTASGIGRLNEEEMIEKLNIPELDGQFIERLFSYSPDRLFCVTRNDSLFMWDGENCSRLEPAGYGRMIRSISYSAKEDVFYIGTTQETILRCSTDFTEISEIAVPGLLSVNDIMCTASGVLWLCSDTGIGTINGNTYRVQKLIMDNSIERVMLDKEGNYWFVSSRQGVLEVCQSIFGNVSQSAGLSGIVANSVERLDNRLYIGHDSGISILDCLYYDLVEDPLFSRFSSVRVRDIFADSSENLWVATKARGIW
ncbi:MAG: hypothetical protein IKN57_00690, partial [Parasporobacterium sp.]|nr:hypothetical protein [Parasporobacterium sp.]